MFELLLPILAVVTAALALGILLSQARKGLNLWCLCACLCLLVLL